MNVAILRWFVPSSHLLIQVFYCRFTIGIVTSGRLATVLQLQLWFGCRNQMHISMYKASLKIWSRASAVRAFARDLESLARTRCIAFELTFVPFSKPKDKPPTYFTREIGDRLGGGYDSSSQYVTGAAKSNIRS